VLSRLFRRQFLEALQEAFRAGKLQFFGARADLNDPKAFAKWLAPLGKMEWVVYAKRPFSGPQAVLAYLSRYTHRVAIANSRLVALDEHGVTFRWKDYRDKGNPDKPRHKTMTLSSDEFMRRFLLHVLPGGFHRIRHFGLIANNGRKEKIALARQLLNVVPAALTELTGEVTVANTAPDEPTRPNFVCAHCGAQMLVVELFVRAQQIRAPPAAQGAP
jgi:hypothetical protein